MIKVVCRTNIDCAKMLKWPTELPERPMVGDLIRSTSSTVAKHIELEVCQLTWVTHSNEFEGKYTALHVDLHLPRHRFENITAFEKFVKEVR